MLANRINRMAPSATVELSETIASLKRQEIDIVAFNLGEPDFPTLKISVAQVRRPSTGDIPSILKFPDFSNSARQSLQS